MNFIHESIHFSNDLQIKIFVHNVSYVQNHWHDALEVLFVLNGEIDIYIDQAYYHLRQDDILVVNPNEMHTVRSDNPNLVLALQVPQAIIHDFLAGHNIKTSCNSSLYSDSQSFNGLRTLLSQMIWGYFKKTFGYELKIKSLLFDVLHTLYTVYPADNDDASLYESTKYTSRMVSIIEYIQQNYTDDITLEYLAETNHLSTAYLSRFFKKYAGTSFKKYITSVRLENAVNDLLSTDESIIQIALNHGFPNIKSFLAAFKETYGEQPSVYRKKIKDAYNPVYLPKSTGNSYGEIQSTDMFTNLYKFLDLTGSPVESVPLPARSIHSISIGPVSKPETHEPTWKKLMTFGKAKDLLNANAQAQLRRAQKEIGFEFIRFHGILDDDMMVYREDRSGNPVFNFSYIDTVFDFLFEIGLKPFVEFGFMPSALARSPHTTFYRPSVISMPKNMDHWLLLIRTFIRHYMERYGQAAVESWYFEFWNEPEITGLFWNDSQEDYLEFYHRTHTAIKSISADLRLGGPAICATPTADIWLPAYFDYCHLHQCMPDFFTFHIYPHVSVPVEAVKLYHYGIYSHSLSENPDFLRDTIHKVLQTIGAHGFSGRNSFLTEWNSTPSHRDLSNDTLYKAAYIVKNIVENMSSLAGFGYWTLSDIIEELPVPSQTFHGGVGLITNNGIKKPGYHAFEFLNRLGPVTVASGSGWYVTSNADGIQVLLYHYCHFDSLYCKLDNSNITQTNRYDIFEAADDKTIALTLDCLKPAYYEVIERSVTRSQGSAFDLWVEIGAPEYMTPYEIDYLSRMSQPGYRRSLENIRAPYSIARTLTPHEIRLIEFRRIPDPLN